MVTFIVDGYNLLHHMEARSARDESLARRRARLEARLRQFVAASPPRTRVILVYDGASGVSSPRATVSGVEVRFARPPHSADDDVLELCREREAHDDVHLVTSDEVDIAGRARGLRLQQWSAPAFAAEMERRCARQRRRRGADAQELSEKPREISSTEVSEWVDRFGFERPAPEEREEPPP